MNSAKDELSPDENFTCSSAILLVRKLCVRTPCHRILALLCSTGLQVGIAPQSVKPICPEKQMLQIDIRSLEAGVHEMDLGPTSEDIGVEIGKFANIRAHIRLDITSNRIFALIKVSAIASLVCDRTLVEFDQPVWGSHAVCYVPPGDIDSESEDDDFIPLKAGAEEIDLTDIVRDTLFLSVPIKKIAPGAKDEDIPSSFGQPTKSDIDPRWRILESLRSQSDSESSNT